MLLGLGLWLGAFGLGAAGAREQVPFWVRLSPEQVAVLPGHSVWLNCSTSCPLVEKPSLQTQLQRGQTLSGPCWVSYELLDVRARNSTASCSVTRAGETRGATARITTYSEGRARGRETGSGQWAKGARPAHLTLWGALSPQSRRAVWSWSPRSWWAASTLCAATLYTCSPSTPWW